MRSIWRHAVARMQLFGSRATGQARNDSDFDFLVEFRPEANAGLPAPTLPTPTPTLPLTLAVSDGMIINVGDQALVVPLASVVPLDVAVMRKVNWSAALMPVTRV